MSPRRSILPAGCSASRSPRYRGWLRPPAGLAGRVRDCRPDRHRRDWQLWRRTGRHITAAGIRVAGVDRSDRQDRRRPGKSDPLDAVSAARAAQSGRARGAPRGRDGAVEAIRALMVARRSAAGERTRTVNQARALLLTGPDDLRAGSPGTPRPPWSPGWHPCVPGPATPSASRCGNWGGARGSRTASSAAWTSSSSRW